MYDISQKPVQMQERYKELPEEITELFEYGTVAQIIDETVKEFGLRENTRDMLQMEIELILYLFLTREGLVERLQDSLEIEKVRAEEIAKKLNDDLFIIVDDLLTFVEEQFAGTGTAATEPVIVVAPPTEPANTAIEPAATANTPAPTVETPAPETNAQQVKPLRTFAMDVDMSRVHGYGAFKSGEAEPDESDTPVHRSSQDDVLGGSK